MPDEGIPYVRIYDTTLREGEQSPLLRVTPEKKLKVIEILDKLGVDIIEAGFPRAQPSDVYVYKEARNIVSRSQLSGFARAVRGDIDLVSESKADIVQIFIPGSDIHIQTMMGAPRSVVYDKLSEAVSYASSKGLLVYIAVTDAPRTSLVELRRIARIAYRLGVEGLVLADTVGLALPGDISKIVATVLEEGVENVGLHLHNDLGLATCNALAGIRAGAREVQVTMGGFGERLGNTPLEEIATIARVKGLFRTGINYSNLVPSIRRALEILGAPVYPLKPIIGDYAFLHVSDIHVYSTLKHPGSFDPFDPEIIGSSRVVRFGKLTGPRSVKLVLERNGIKVSDDEARLIAKEIRDTYDKVDALDEAGLVKFAKTVLSKVRGS